MERKQNKRIVVLLLLLTIIGFLGLTHPVNPFRNAIYFLFSVGGVSGSITWYLVNFKRLNRRYNLWILFAIIMLVFGFLAYMPEFRSEYKSLSTQVIILSLFGLSGFMIHLYDYLKSIAL